MDGETLLEAIRKDASRPEILHLQEAILLLPRERREREKNRLFAEDPHIISSIARLTASSETTVRRVLMELYGQEGFFASFADSLAELEEVPDAGDVRMLSSLLYVVVRILQPSVALETGVANGRSTLYILKGLEDNRRGHLTSIDKPSLGSQKQSDGFIVRLARGRAPGWLVPDVLRKRWTLVVGESSDVLPTLLPTLAPIDFFFHDSLHTYANMSLEFESVRVVLRPGAIMMADNIDENLAYVEYVIRHRIEPWFLRRMGGARVP